MRKNKSALLILIFILLAVFGLGLFAFSAEALAAETYFAAPSSIGNKNGSSPENAFQIADFWDVAQAGDILYLLKGIYTGDKSMIYPPKGLNGTMNDPITIKAFNDGEVEIDGEKQRPTVLLRENSYFILEGFNTHDAYRNPDVAVIQTGSFSNNNIIRRVVAWDAMDSNNAVFQINGVNNLLEDVAGFGIGRKIFSSSYSYNSSTIIRRAWGSWDGGHAVGPKMTYTLAYNNYGMTCENCIGTWTAQDMQQIYTLKNCDAAPQYYFCNNYTFTNYAVDQPYGIFGVDRLDGDNKTSNSKILGSIAYVTSGDRFSPAGLYFVSGIDSFEIKDSVAYIAPGEFFNKRTFGLYRLNDSLWGNNLATNLSGIGGNGSYIDDGWEKHNITEGQNIAFVGNAYNNSNGSNICHRYINRQLTSEPLWPWPMGKRILDATTKAGKRPVDVTEIIEEMLGPIPDECKNNPPDVNGDGRVNIKDIQACIKVITNSQTDTNIIAKCNALAAPIGNANIKDIQVIIREIIN